MSSSRTNPPTGEPGADEQGTDEQSTDGSPGERSLARRCDELERRSTHQERLIETLSEQLHEAFLQIRALQQQIKRLEARQQTETTPFGPAGERPPHY